MVQAAARGVVDFSDADLLDRRWWIRLWLLLDQVEADNVVLVRRMEHAHNAALLDYNLPDQAFDLHWERAGGAVTNVWDVLFPWCKVGVVGAAVADKLAAAWINRWGDPNDPATQKKIQRAVTYLKNMGARAAKRQTRPKQRTVVRRKVK